MASKEVTIQIRESQASKPFIEVFEEDQKLWEVYKFAEEVRNIQRESGN